MNDNKFDYFRTSFTFTSGQEKPLELFYTQADLMLSTLDGLKKDLRLLPQETQFKGFSSGKANLSIELEGVSSTSNVILVDICGQAFYSGLEDFIIPLFGLGGEYSSFYGYGETLSIIPAQVRDVLDGYSECYITLKAPSGKRLLEDAKNELQTVVLNEYGFYRLEYYYSDSIGNSHTYIVGFQVENNIPPVITITWDIEMIEKGQTLTLPKATAVDDLDGEIAVVCTVSAPNGKITLVSDDCRYAFTTQGTYRVRYFAVDSVGNITDKIYYVTVD